MLKDQAVGRFERLFSPRSIAIIGAGEDATRPGGQVLHSLQQFGYRGKICPVNPKYMKLLGYRCYPSIAEIGAPVDLAVLAVPASVAGETIRSCGEAGVPYAVVLSGGFRESGAEGMKRQQLLVAHARTYGMRLVGPNCVGIVNIHERVYAAFGSISRPPLLAPGGVSLVMQSGGFGNSLALGCHAAKIGFRLVIASGNEADLTAPELIDALIDDPATEIILAYIEGVTDGRALMAAGERGLRAGKPIIVWKAGNTEQGGRVAATHTANMTGIYDVWRAAFRQCGILEVADIGEAADYIKALSPRKYPRGRNVAVVSPSGGAAVAFSDAADAYKLTLTMLRESTAEKLHEVLSDAVSMNNPIDLGAGGISARTQDRVKAVIELLLEDDEIHQLCLMFPTLIGPRAAAGTTILTEVVQLTDKPILVCWTVPREVVADCFETLERANVPVLFSPVCVARAAGMLANYARFRDTHVKRRMLSAGEVECSTADLMDFAGQVGPLNEVWSKRIVSAAGIEVSHDVMLASADDPKIDDITWKFPVAVKIVSPDITHKSDIGGVELAIADRNALRAAVKTVMANTRQTHPEARVDGVIVSEMVRNAVEVIVGTVNDAVFGPVIMVGMGGILAEAMRDVSYRVAPFDRMEADEMINELRARHVLNGIRGRPACDVEALADALVKLSQFAWQNRERISELDINPLLIRQKGSGVVAVDAVVVLR